MREQERMKVQLSVVQIIAGALASVSAAVVASTFGLKGTLVGAAVTSIVASVGSAIYTHSLHRARVRIQTRFNPHTGAIERVVVRPQRVQRPIRWGRVAGAAALVFVLAMGTITVVEVAARRPVAALVRSTPPQHGGTTVGTLLRDAPGGAPIALPTIPASSPPGSAVTVTPNGTPSTSPTPGGRVTVTPAPTATRYGTPSLDTPRPATASTATIAHEVAATTEARTPTAPARTATATPHTSASPTPTPAKGTAATATLAVGSPQAGAAAVGTPSETLMG